MKKSEKSDLIELEFEDDDTPTERDLMRSAINVAWCTLCLKEDLRNTWMENNY